MSLIAQFFSVAIGNRAPERPKRSLVPLERDLRPPRTMRPTEEELDALLHEEAALFTEERSQAQYSWMAPDRVDLS